jgi:WD40 repeat protein
MITSPRTNLLQVTAMSGHNGPGMLAAAGSRALLVSSGSYVPESRLEPVPTAAASVMDLGRCLVERAGLDPSRLEILADPANPQDFSTALDETAEQATDVLFFWYTGHGLVSPSQELHLATRATIDLTQAVPEYQALPYPTAKSIIKRCRARLVVVGLDCCFAGRAEGWAIRNGDDPFDVVRQQGVYVLASGGRNDAAYGPPSGYTAFTGAMIRLLTEGDAAAPPLLTLDDIYQSLSRTLPQAGLPRPRRFAADEADMLPVVPNPAYQTGAATPGRPEFRTPTRFSPYRGLASFESEDARFFFGREELTRTLVGLLGERLSVSCPLVVTGPSGCGKSSLLRAGLVPALQQMQPSEPDRSRPSVLFLTPGTDPLGNLVKHIADADRTSRGRLREQVLADPDSFATAIRKTISTYPAGLGRGSAPLVVVADQFEEIFAPGIDEAQRAAFIAALCSTCRQHEGTGCPVLVVLGVRADFFGHCASYSQLVAALQSPVVVGPMTAEQLRSVITKPAEMAGLVLEDGLTDILLEDLAITGRSADGPGAALPLLSHALLVTWMQRQESRLTLAGYHASGGIARSLAKTADMTLGSLDLTSQQIARRLLLRLVQLGDGTEDTRRYAPLNELLPPADAPDHAAARHVLDAFVRARLVTVDADTARITHEALLRAWPQFHAWIDTDRASLLASQQLAQDAATWDRNGREPAFLYDGSRLATAQAAAAEQHRIDLTSLERAFLEAGTRRARRKTKRSRQLIAVLASLVLLTGSLAGYAFQQRRDAASARDQADSREVAAEAEQVRGEDPSLAAQLSLAAYQIDPTSSALASLLESAAYPDAARFQDSASLVQAVTLNHDRRVLAVAGADGTLRLWDVAQPSHPAPLGKPLTRLKNSPLYTAAFSPDGHLLAAAGAGETIGLWQVSDPRHAVAIGRLTGPTNTVFALAFSPSGRILAVGSADKAVRLWDVADPRRPVPLGSPLTGPAGSVQAVAFSPDGRILAVGSADNTVHLWNTSNPRHPVPLGRPLTGPSGTVDALAFSPSGSTLVAGSRDDSVWLWNLSNPARPVRARAPLGGATSWVNAVAFSPDGRILAAAGGNQVLLWNITTGTLLEALSSPQAPTSLTWDGDHVLIAGEADGMVRLWKVPSPVLSAGGRVDGVSISPAGDLLAIAGPDLQLWDPATRTQVAQVAITPKPTTVAWAPHSPVLATGYSNGTIRLWRADSGHLAPLGKPLSASATGLVELAAFRPDGRILASAADDGTVRLWNVTNPAQPKLLSRIDDSGSNVFSVAFSPNGRILAAAGADDLTRLWDVADPARPRLLGKPLAGLNSYAYSVAFSSNGHTLAVGSADRTIRLWDISKPGHPHTIGSPLTGPGGYVFVVAFNPLGTRLAAGSTDGTVWMWNVTNPATPILITHVTDSVSQVGRVYTLAFNPDGRMLAVGNTDGSVRLWDLRPSAAAAAICATAGQPLTHSEWDTYIPGRPYAPPCAH